MDTMTEKYHTQLATENMILPVSTVTRHTFLLFLLITCNACNKISMSACPWLHSDTLLKSVNVSFV